MWFKTCGDWRDWLDFKLGQLLEGSMLDIRQEFRLLPILAFRKNNKIQLQANMTPITSAKLPQERQRAEGRRPTSCTKKILC